MAFPISPTDGQTTLLNGIVYQYSSATRSWTRLPQNKISAGAIAPANPAPGNQWYDTSTDILFTYLNDGTSQYWLDGSSPSIFASNTLSIGGDGTIVGNLAVGGSISSGGNVTGTYFVGTATSARYADLAENYLADSDYLPGTVVVFGGEKEITITNIDHDTRVAGVISTAPAYLMNNELTGLPVALTGRVPCQVQGPVVKGDLLVTSDTPGVAKKLNLDLYKPGCVIGKSMEQLATDEIQTIEIAVGRF